MMRADAKCSNYHQKVDYFLITECLACQYFIPQQFANNSKL